MFGCRKGRADLQEHDGKHLVEEHQAGHIAIRAFAKARRQSAQLPRNRPRFNSCAHKDATHCVRGCQQGLIVSTRAPIRTRRRGYNASLRKQKSGSFCELSASGMRPNANIKGDAENLIENQCTMALRTFKGHGSHFRFANLFRRPAVHSSQAPAWRRYALPCFAIAAPGSKSVGCPGQGR